IERTASGGSSNRILGDNQSRSSGPHEKLVAQHESGREIVPAGLQCEHQPVDASPVDGQSADRHLGGPERDGDYALIVRTESAEAQLRDTTKNGRTARVRQLRTEMITYARVSRRG